MSFCLKTKKEISEENNYSYKKILETKKKVSQLGKKTKERSVDVRLEKFCAFILTKKSWKFNFKKKVKIEEFWAQNRVIVILQALHFLPLTKFK